MSLWRSVLNGGRRREGGGKVKTSWMHITEDFVKASKARTFRARYSADQYKLVDNVL